MDALPSAAVSEFDPAAHVTCSSCHATDSQFDSATANRDLRRYHRKGPDAPTRAIVRAVRAIALPAGGTLLDIGGGVGAIHHLLLERDFTQARQVDASAAYLAVAAAEASRIGHRELVEFLHADFGAVADDVPAADLVTLDRVVCCDPDYARLLGPAATHARRALALSYPRPRLLVRMVVVIVNAMRRLAGRSFRVYLHPPGAIRAVLERSGLHSKWSGGTWIWAVELFVREV